MPQLLAMMCVHSTSRSWLRWVTALILVHFCLVVAMAASPALHLHLHHDAAGHDHECAATLLAVGSVESVGPEAACPVPALPPTYLLAFPSGETLLVATPERAFFGRAPPRLF